MNRLMNVLAAGLPLALSLTAHAYTIQVRVVERVGDVNFILPPGDTITVRPNSIHRYRLQFMVVPDDENDALGGFIGWNFGTITTTGGLNFRTARPPNPHPRGRIVPFNFANSPDSEGIPNTDPFVSLQHVDCGMGWQAFLWECGPDGTPNPQPQPTIYGRGEFVSVHEITSGAIDQNYTITYAGHLVVGRPWGDFFCDPPDCGDPNNPSDDKPSICQYDPLQYPNPDKLFSYTLHVRVCPAEWNEDRQLNSQDLFDYLNDFFSNEGDFNEDGKTSPDDLYEYLDTFLSACS